MFHSALWEHDDTILQYRACLRDEQQAALRINIFQSYFILKSRNWQPNVVSNSCYNIIYTDMDTETKPFSSSAYHILPAEADLPLHWDCPIKFTSPPHAKQMIPFCFHELQLTITSYLPLYCLCKLIDFGVPDAYLHYAHCKVAGYNIDFKVSAKRNCLDVCGYESGIIQKGFFL